MSKETVTEFFSTNTKEDMHEEFLLCLKMCQRNKTEISDYKINLKKILKDSSG